MSSAKPRERKCASCRFYEQSPLWRRGWCRNPLLYDPQTNHLVEADTLACRRTFIDYWEARRPGQQGASFDPPDLEPHLPKVRRAPSIPLTATGPGGAPLRGNGATVAAVQAAAANQPRERAPQLSLVRPATRPLDTQPDPAPPVDPHADTMAIPRITPAPVPAAPPQPAAPSNAVVVGRPEPALDEGDRTRIRRILVAALILATLIFVVIYERPHLGLGSAGAATTPTPDATQTAQAFALLPTNTPAPPPTATVPPPPKPTAVPTAKPLVLGSGANAQLTGLNAGNLNVRQAATTKARVLGVLRPNVTVKVVAGPQTADGITWWQITGWDAKNTPGWASGKYLKPVP